MSYVHVVSKSLRRTLTPLGIRTYFKPHKTIRQMLCKPKDPIPDLQQSGIVYRIPCSKCLASYIGQTGRRLEQRVKEHKRSVAQADFNSSALAEHAWTLEHEVDWISVKVVSNARDLVARLAEEAATIKSTKEVLNRDGGTLAPEYMRTCLRLVIESHPFILFFLFLFFPYLSTPSPTSHQLNPLTSPPHSHV